MKGSARLVTGSLRASAHAVGGMAVRAWALPSGVAVSARPTDAVSLLKYLRVMPEQPQGLVWLVPQYGIDYTIESNTNWNIK
jgi:hypothetical protein